MANGYIPYDKIGDIILRLTDNEINLVEKDLDIENLVSFVSKYKKVAAVELQTAFSLEQTKLQNAVCILTESSFIGNRNAEAVIL